MALNDEVMKAEKAKIRKRVFRMIQSMYTLFAGSGTDIQIIDAYMKLWKPKGDNDVADAIIWPYEGKKRNPRFAKRRKANCCLYALVTECMKEFHIYYADPITFTGDMDAVLTEIELFIKGKVDYPIRGSEETGFYLWNKKITGSRITGSKSLKPTSSPPRR